MSDTGNTTHAPQPQRRDISRAFVSVTAPAFNEAGAVRELYERIVSALDGLVGEFEVLIVDNGSVDDTLEILKDIATQDRRLRYVSLSRNFGHQGGLLAAMSHARGDVVITMDADLQHPPESIPAMLEKWAEGFDIIGARKQDLETTSRRRRMANHVFYRGLGSAIGYPLAESQSDFRLLSREALDALLAMPERDKFLRGLTHWVGFNQTSVPVEIHARKSGYSKFRFLSLLFFAVHGMVSFTVLPLRLLTIAGFVLSFSSILYSAFLVLDWLIGSNNVPSGFTTLATGLFLLGGVQLLGLGIIGEYLGQTLNQTRRRPHFIVRETSAPAAPHSEAPQQGAGAQHAD